MKKDLTFFSAKIGLFSLSKTLTEAKVNRFFRRTLSTARTVFGRILSEEAGHATSLASDVAAPPGIEPGLQE